MVQLLGSTFQGIYFEVGRVLIFLTFCTYLLIMSNLFKFYLWYHS